MARNSTDLQRLCLGIITGPHGIRGAVRVKSFTADPLDIDAYGPVSDGTGTRSFKLRVTGQVKGSVIASIEGVTDRNGAEALKGLQLYVGREQLPPPEDEEFYHADLIGLDADLISGGNLGRVAAVHDFGAGEALEIAQDGGGILMVPFTRAAVPVVDIPAGRLLIDPPAGLLEKPEPPAPLAGQADFDADAGVETEASS